MHVGRVGSRFSLRSTGMTAKIGTRVAGVAKGIVMRTIDIHSHVLTEETMGLIGKEFSALKPRMTPIDADNFVLEVAGTPYRPFPRGGFDLESRFADMAAAEVDMQV